MRTGTFGSNFRLLPHRGLARAGVQQQEEQLTLTLTLTLIPVPIPIPILILTATSRMAQIWWTVLYRDIVRRRRCASVHVCMATPTWPGSAPLRSHPPPPPPCPLSPRDTDTHSRTASPWTLLEPMGSTAALQLCSSAWICVFGHPLIALNSPVRRRVLASWRPPCQAQRQPTRPQILPFPRIHSSAVLWPKAPLMLQPEASLTSPSSCTSATTAMPPCPARPCLALPCALAPPGSSSAPGLNWTCPFWVGLAWLTCRFFRLAAARPALLSAGSAVDSSEDTSPSLHIAGHRDPLFCHRCRLVRSDFVNGYLVQSPPDCVTSNHKYRYQPPPGPACCSRHCPQYGYTVNICVPVLDLSTLTPPHWKARHPCCLGIRMDPVS